ncbi:hypothetical protein CBR_g8047 [Chara braunii]|uniref:Leucine zipper with capping helix domain-containing protein n=1 Tax=Chara braunii TaxID=69332 RepID=A0A388KL13_CHABU|nr:hypothetical protein CBR_g8047 [Chara braunii]|eukprot:GBG70749.1 hypothetical protein CBR_g8047 [Chara braunii]
MTRIDRSATEGDLYEMRHRAELQQYAENDPEVLNNLKDVSKRAYDAANRWTDNIFALQQWCSNSFPQAAEELQKVYQEVGIEEDFDYIE